MEVNQLAGAVARARAASAAVDEFRAQQKQLLALRGDYSQADHEEYLAARGDVLMDAAHALAGLLRVLEASGRAPAITAVLPDGAATLAPSDLLTVLGALADAAQARTDCAESWCQDCETHPAGACQSHVDDLDRAAAYLALARDLGIEVDR